MTSDPKFKGLNLAAACGLYYKPMMIVNDNSRVITKLETSITDDTRVIIYDRHMFIVQATGLIDKCEKKKN
jgi:hypothetical protein